MYLTPWRRIPSSRRSGRRIINDILMENPIKKGWDLKRRITLLAFIAFDLACDPFWHCCLLLCYVDVWASVSKVSLRFILWFGWRNHRFQFPPLGEKRVPSKFQNKMCKCRRLEDFNRHFSRFLLDSTAPATVGTQQPGPMTPSQTPNTPYVWLITLYDTTRKNVSYLDWFSLLS